LGNNPVVIVTLNVAVPEESNESRVIGNVGFAFEEKKCFLTKDAPERVEGTL
jgi:hypothetical protein